MLIEFDETKRANTIEERGLDFANAGQVLDGAQLTQVDECPRLRRTAQHHLRCAGRTHGGSGLDPAWRGSPHHFHEVCQ